MWSSTGPAAPCWSAPTGTRSPPRRWPSSIAFARPTPRCRGRSGEARTGIRVCLCRGGPAGDRSELSRFARTGQGVCLPERPGHRVTGSTCSGPGLRSGARGRVSWRWCRRSRSSSVARALMVQPRGVMAMMCVSRDGGGTCVLSLRLVKARAARYPLCATTGKDPLPTR